MFEPHWMSSRVGGRVIEQNWEDMHPSLEAVAIREAFHSRFKRLRAIIEDLAYSGMSHQEIADKYGQEVGSGACPGVRRRLGGDHRHGPAQ
jgi:DNA-directed RNA polymerase specialized sigma24 family protein